MAAVLNLDWEHDWNQISSLVLCSEVCSCDGGLVQVNVSLTRLITPSSCLRSAGKIGCSGGQVRAGASPSGAGVLPPSLQGLQRPERENSIGSCCKYTLKPLLFSFGNVKEPWKWYVPNLPSFFIPFLVHPISYLFYICSQRNMNQTYGGEKGFLIAQFLAHISWLTHNIFVRIPPVKPHHWLIVDGGWLSFYCCCPAKKISVSPVQRTRPLKLEAQNRVVTKDVLLPVYKVLLCNKIR